MGVFSLCYGYMENKNINPVWAFVGGALITLIIAVGIVWFVVPDAPQEPVVSGFTTASTANHATSSTAQVGPQETITLFSSNDSCSGRFLTIPSGGAAVRLSFDSDITPSATVGELFGASTTHSLPAELYGCGAVRAYAAASTTVSKSEYIR